MTIIMEINGADTVAARLLSTGGKVRQSAKSTLDAWAIELASYIQESKLSGSPLHRRSGSLSSSIHGFSGEDDGAVYGAVGGGADVPYAHIHEFGGLIPAHQVVARNAQALCFTVDGVKRFAKSVQIPEVTMPERSYMRSSFQEKAPDGIAQLRAAILGAIGVA